MIQYDSKNQCMGCQAGWPLVDGWNKTTRDGERKKLVMVHMVPLPGYPGERVWCTKDNYESIQDPTVSESDDK